MMRMPGSSASTKEPWSPLVRFTHEGRCPAEFAMNHDTTVYFTRVTVVSENFEELGLNLNDFKSMSS